MNKEAKSVFSNIFIWMENAFQKNI